VGERGTTMAAHGERQRLQADHAARLAGRAARLRAALHQQPGLPPVQEEPGPADQRAARLADRRAASSAYNGILASRRALLVRRATGDRRRPARAGGRRTPRRPDGARAGSTRLSGDAPAPRRARPRTGWKADRTPVSCSERSHRRRARSGSCAAAERPMSSGAHAGHQGPVPLVLRRAHLQDRVPRDRPDGHRVGGRGEPHVVGKHLLRELVTGHTALR